MAAHTTFGTKGKIIHSQAREIIANVVAFMKKEAEYIASDQELDIPIANYKQRAMAATGISEKMYKSVAKESKAVHEGASTSFSSPRSKRSKKSIYELVEGEEHAVRDIIHNFHIMEKRTPTIKGIMNRMNDVGIPFTGSEKTLRNLIRKLGFRWRRTQDNRKILMESYDIRLKRIQYLEKLFQYRKDGRPIFYTDESYIHTSHLPNFTWDDQSGQGMKKSVGKGRRLILVHAGGENGFLHDGLLLFPSGCKSGDYHDDMNWDNFEKWTKTQLLPNLPPKSVLVVDNASYHNVRAISEPTTATKKADMISWLQIHKIPHDPSVTKPVLYNIIKQHKSEARIYKLDILLNEKGHSVLRLPPYHPELNPIEKIWAQVKHYVAVHNVQKQNMNSLISLTRQSFENITNENWANVCGHVRKVEEKYKTEEPILDDNLDRLILHVNTGSSDEEDDEEDSDSDMSDTDIGVTPL